jgi:hypothetical protein
MNLKNGSNSSKQTRYLVVLTPGGIFWLLWCLDYIDVLVKGGKSVVVLDLHQLVAKTRICHKLQGLRRLYRKNSQEKLICDLKKIERVKTLKVKAFSRNKTSVIEYHDIHSIDFKNGLDAEFFEEMGQRIIQEDILNQNSLLKSKRIFNFAFSCVLEAIKTEEVTHLAVPGGRTLIPAAILSAGLSTGIEAVILESNDRGGLGYAEYFPDFRSNCNGIQENIKKTWDSEGYSKYEIAEKFMENKLYRQDSKGINFVQNLLDIQLIEELHDAAYVVFFLTSGFEFKSFPGELQIGDFSKMDQMEKVKRFCEIAIEYGYIPIVRAHPPRPGHEKTHAMDDREWSEICMQIGAIYISTENRLNSYELMKNSKLNAVYLSTAAIDSMILGAQTIILGNSEFAQLLPELCAFNETSIRARFDKIEIKVDLNRVLPYAYYMATLGKELENSWVTSEGNVYYKGKEIDGIRFSLIRNLITKFRAPSYRR